MATWESGLETKPHKAGLTVAFTFGFVSAASNFGPCGTLGWTKIASAKQIPYIMIHNLLTKNRTPPYLNNFWFEKITWLTLLMKMGTRYQKLILFLLLQSLFLYLLVWVERLPFRLWLCQVFFILNQKISIEFYLRWLK